MPATALAQPHVIADLSEGALLGPIGSTAQLQDDFRANRSLIAGAGNRLGLTAGDMTQVRNAIASGNVRYVVMPHRLDGMAGSYRGRAFAVHDVIVPADVHAWEVDVTEPDATVRVFVPNKCGNVSYVRTPRRVVAQRYTYVAPRPVAKAVDSPAYAPPAPAFLAQSAPAPESDRAPLASVSIASNAVTPHHHFAVLPWLALGLIGIALSNHGHGGGAIGTLPVTANAPHPAPAPAPTPAPVKGCG